MYRFEPYHWAVTMEEVDMWKVFDACLCVTRLSPINSCPAGQCQGGKSILSNEVRYIANRCSVAYVELFKILHGGLS